MAKKEKDCCKEEHTCHCHENEHECHCGDNCGCNDNGINYLEVAQRIQAEFENYKRRNKDIEKTSYKNGIVNTVRSLLPVIDSFNQAVEGIHDENILKGLNIIRNQIMSAFLGLGVKPIECVGKKFDPNFHNAVLAVEDEKYESGVVLEEFQQGFILDDTVIRHSVVKINR